MSKVLAKLNFRERQMANALNVQSQNLGYNPKIDLLTSLIKGVAEQVLPTRKLSDYFPVEVGNGAWRTQLTKITSYYTGDDFESGFINSAEDNSRLAEMSSAAGTLNYPIVNWAKSVTWSLPQLEQAAQTGVYDFVVSVEKSRKMNWLMGIQKIAFLGNVQNGLGGLITSGTSAPVTDLIYKNETISNLSPENYSTFVANVLSRYRVQTNYTVWPDRFFMPETDFTGMSSPTSPVYPIVNKLDYLESAFKQQTGNQNFKIYPIFYAQPEFSGLPTNRYGLYRSDSDSLAFQIPVDYSSTLANSINGFQYATVGYGQIGGMCIYRDQELMYIDQNTAVRPSA